MDKVISVIIPTYNRKRLTDRAIESVKSISPDLVEIIVVDDCGTEPYAYNSLNNIHGILVSVIRCQKNVGPGLARMAGVEVASGKLVAFLDSDDTFGCVWVDAMLKEYANLNDCMKDSVLFSGKVEGGKLAQHMVWLILMGLPHRMSLWTGRIISLIFNPFYIQASAMSKKLFHVIDGVRYCEDYFTTVSAIFRAKRLVILSDLACIMGRSPKSLGGLSAERNNMFHGEMTVRLEMLKSDFVPLLFKPIIPVGIFYQYLRTLISVVLNRR